MKQLRAERIAKGLCRDCGSTWRLPFHVICQPCKSKRREQFEQRKSVRIESGKCYRCGAPAKPTAQHCEPCATKKIAQLKAVRRRNKLRIIELFGGKCENCNESDFRTLTLDHVNGDGHIDCAGKTKRIRAPEHYARVLAGYDKTGELPKDLALLCFNCHAKKDLFPDDAG